MPLSTIYRLPAVLGIAGLSKTTIYWVIGCGDFPRLV